MSDTPERPAVNVASLHRRLLNEIDRCVDPAGNPKDVPVLALRDVAALHAPELFGGLWACLACSPGMPPPILVLWADCETVRAIASRLRVVTTTVGYGRRNPHCSNCGDLRGGPFGHEISECLYRQGMTAAEVADLPHLAEHKAEFWDAMIGRYFAERIADHD